MTIFIYPPLAADICENQSQATDEYKSETKSRLNS